MVFAIQRHVRVFLIRRVNLQIAVIVFSVFVCEARFYAGKDENIMKIEV